MEKFKKFHLSNGPKIITNSIPGSKSKELLKKQRRIESNIVSYPRQMPFAIRQAKGAIVEDVDGNQYIDFFSFCGVVNLGHCNAYITKWADSQQKQLIHALDFPTQNKISLIEAILKELPAEIRDNYKVGFCAPSGSDAIEAAIKMAKLHTKRSAIIAFQGSYHGLTSGSLSVTSDVRYRENLNSLIPDVHFIPYSYCYRCPYSKERHNCSLECAEAFRKLIENRMSGISKPAAVIVEPIQGEGGNIVAPDAFLERIIEIAHEHGIPVIFDEIQCGFFRSGKFLASSYLKSFPDIFTISKGLGGVGYPISAVVYDRRIETWPDGMHVGTFRANQVSIAAARGALNFVREYKIESHMKKISDLLISKLKELQLKSDFIGDIRGRGLIIGVEIVKDRVTREPFPQLADRTRRESLKRGLLFETGGHYQNVIRFLPPLIINEEMIHAAMDIFKRALHRSIKALEMKSKK
jgi:diaminobutyrate-2-oxoglutarate transaminase